MFDFLPRLKIRNYISLNNVSGTIYLGLDKKSQDNSNHGPKGNEN